MNSKNPAVPSLSPLLAPAPEPRPERRQRAAERHLRGAALAAAGMLPWLAAAQTSPAPPAPATSAAAPAAAASAPGLIASPRLQALPTGDDARQLPIVLRARSIRSQPELRTVAEGDVEFRRGGLVISADRLSYDTPEDLANASGKVRISRAGAVYTGPELELSVQRFEGWFLQPEFELTALGARGSADRIDFLGPARSRATNARYSSCPREEGVEPDWVLKTRSVRIDLDANEGVAEGAVLRFLGTPIIALPALSFPLGDTRKSGWLPPSINIDNRSGVELSVPYYWNIAPQRDATFAPRVITRRGLGLDSEFRYLEPRYEGSVNFDWLPRDRIAGRSRESLQWLHEGRLGRTGLWRAELLRVSDDDWWKDFPNANRSLTNRLLPLRLAAERPFSIGAAAEGQFYARTLHWQVLQSADSFIDSPYQRAPQLGVRASGALGRADSGWEFALESEFNRFTLPSDAASAGRPVGDRWHLLGSISRPFRQRGWWLVPKLALNLAAYRTRDVDGGLSTTFSRDAHRAIPSLSVDTGFEFERSTRAFGRTLQQTLEPRLLYVSTPYRAQSQLPNYDSAAKDFNFVSIYTDNAFSGIDRVSDSHQYTAGVTTRLVDTVSGAEVLRLGLVQRYLLRTQRVAPQADGTPDGPPLEQRFSDALLLGSTSVFPGWTLDGAVQYSPDIRRSVRSIVGARYSPGPYRTVGATYRLARGLSEQVEVGWQWPVYGGKRDPAGKPGGCGGAWYSVGRFNYSVADSRITDSVLGLEYDAGCWIGRIVAERLSTGRSEATTRLLIQLELVGLSRLGSNPLKVLKENIPGYRMLRDPLDARDRDLVAPAILPSPAPVPTVP
jgi:LPS-assembly protein